MHYALIKDGSVKNIIVADEKFAEHIKSQWDTVLPLEEGSLAKIGHIFDGKEIIIPSSPDGKVNPIRSWLAEWRRK